MDFTEGQRKLLLYWGNIQQSARSRASTAELWAAVRAAAKADNNPLSGVRATDMNVLRSIATAQGRAGNAFQGARIDSVIDSTMIARDLSSRDQQSQNLAPRFLVRFEHDVTINGALTTLWRTSTVDGSLPTTKGDVLSMVERDAQAMADDYGVTHVGVGRVEIVGV